MKSYASPYEVERLKVIARLLSHVPRSEGIVAVDIGCGQGRVGALAEDLGYTCIGYDLDHDTIEEARQQYPHREFHVGSTQESVEVPRSLTLALEVIEHIPSSRHKSFIDQIARATVPGGYLLLSTPSRYSLVATAHRMRNPQHSYDWRDPTHVGVMSSRKLLQLLVEGGFKVIRLLGYDFLPGERWPFAIQGRVAMALGFDMLVLAQLS